VGSNEVCHDKLFAVLPRRAVYYITLERISTGEQAQSLVTRQASEEAARANAEDAIRQSPDAGDLWVVDVEARP
jgi:hypothetical protein